MPQDYFGQELDLETLLQGTIEEYERKRAEAWKEDKDGTHYLAFFDGLAKWMLRSVTELTVADDDSSVKWETALALLDVAHLANEIKEKIQIDIDSCRPLIALGCSNDEIADCLGISRKTLERRLAENSELAEAFVILRKP